MVSDYLSRTAVCVCTSEHFINPELDWSVSSIEHWVQFRFYWGIIPSPEITDGRIKI